MARPFHCRRASLAIKEEWAETIGSMKDMRLLRLVWALGSCVSSLKTEPPRRQGSRASRRGPLEVRVRACAAGVGVATIAIEALIVMGLSAEHASLPSMLKATSIIFGFSVAAQCVALVTVVLCLRTRMRALLRRLQRIEKS